MKKLILHSFIHLLFISLFSGCGGGEPVNTGPIVNTSRAVQGKIRNHSTGVGIPNINVSVGQQKVTTGTDGSYQVPVVATGIIPRVIVTADGAGFSKTSKIISIEAGATAKALLDIDLLPIAFTGTFDPTQSFSAEVAGTPAQVTVPAGTLVKTDGSLPTGNITADLTPINPALDIDLMPGDMTISTGEPIASYGALTAEFKDASGNPLNLATGQTATIRIPVSNKGSSTPPAIIPLYYFDSAQGIWVEEGTATLSSDGAYYEGSVGHFSTWNADYLYSSITITGKVVDENGNAVANALVYMGGFSYNGKTTTRTDADGNFSITAMTSEVSLIVASTSEGVSNTVKIGDDESTAENYTLPQPLVIGTAPLTVRLSWGKNPSDLDTHVIGPNNYHIYFSSKGNLVDEPFAQLDVDDTSSYGPEVFTALRFPKTGTYHYAIYHYAGSSTISASPARVELTRSGQTSVFIPPAGQTTEKWWNVFDITVNTDGAVTQVTPINTWSSTQPTSGGARGKWVMPSKK